MRFSLNLTVVLSCYHTSVLLHVFSKAIQAGIPRHALIMGLNRMVALHLVFSVKPHCFATEDEKNNTFPFLSINDDHFEASKLMQLLSLNFSFQSSSDTDSVC